VAKKAPKPKKTTEPKKNPKPKTTAKAKKKATRVPAPSHHPAPGNRQPQPTLTKPERELISLFGTARAVAVAPHNGELSQALEKLKAKGQVRKARKKGPRGEIIYERIVPKSKNGSSRPRVTLKRSAAPLSARAAAAAAIQKGDLVELKEFGAQGCVRNVDTDGSFWVCAPFMGLVIPVQLDGDSLRRIGPGSGICACNEP
jgi:hypothetical protein